MIEVPVDDAADSRLADYTDLKDPVTRARRERDGGFFIAEGMFVIERLLRSRLPIRSLLLTPNRFDSLRSQLAGRDVTVFTAERRLMERIVGFDIHRGALASAERPSPIPVERVVAGANLVAALEGLNDHENLGAIFRTATALGVDAVVLDSTCADPWYRRSVRVSMGTVMDIPMGRTGRLPDQLHAMRTAGFRTVALTLSPEAVPLLDVTPGGPTVVVLGAEGTGLSPAAIGACELEVTIPMRAGVDSLNVGHAAAIALHHFGSTP